jgi:hypothetical protein
MKFGLKGPRDRKTSGVFFYFYLFNYLYIQLFFLLLLHEKSG